MINFKKAVSVVVLFSFVLCSCGNKSPLDRGGESCSKEKAKIEECSDEVASLLSLKEDKDLLNELCQSNYSVCINDTKCAKKCNSKNISHEKCIENCKHEVNVATDVKSCIDTLSVCNQGVDNVESKVKEKSETMRSKCVTSDDLSAHPAYIQLKAALGAVEKVFEGKGEEYLPYKYDKVVQLLAKQVLEEKISEKDALERAEKRVKRLPKAVEIIGETKFNEEVLVPGKVGLVYFFSENCPHCKNFAPTADALASIYGETAKVYKVDAVKNEALADKYGVKDYPTLFLLEDKELTEIKDSTHIDRLKGRIDEALSKQKKKEKPT